MTGIKQVRATNGDKFIQDFKSPRTIMVYSQTTKLFLHVGRTEVWNMAKENVIKYHMTDKIFRNGRTVMVII